MRKPRVPTFEKSVASIEEWMKDWDYNKNDIKPHLVFASGRKMCWWLCNKCNHSYQMTPNAKESTVCPECVRLDVYNNSLAIQRPDLARHWHHEKNEKSPYDYKVRSNIKVWWLCDICGYEWESIITNRSRNKTNICPNCNGRVLNDENNLESKYPEIAGQWNYEKNGNTTPKDIFAVSHDKYRWKCEHGHEWEAIVANRVKGRGCPHCNKKHFTSYGEQALYFYVRKIFPDAINTHKENYVYDTVMEVDIFIPSHKICIEYDGVWFHNNEKSEVKDFNKNSMSLYKDFAMIRLRETGLPDILFSHCILNCDPHKTNLNEKIKEVLDLISSLIDNTEIKYKIQKLEINHQADSHFILDGLNRNNRDDGIDKTHSYLLPYWSAKNGDLMPQSFTYGSSQKVWWSCPECLFEWQCDTKHMTKRKLERLCSKCCDIKVESLQVRQPEIALLWHPTKNGGLTPYDVKPNSKEKVYWMNEDGTESYCQVKSKVDGIKDRERRKQRKLKQETGKL